MTNSLERQITDLAEMPDEDINMSDIPEVTDWSGFTRAPKIGVYAGSFDPVTRGHLQVIADAKNYVDKLIIAPGTNIRKSPMFSFEERVDLIQQSLIECNISLTNVKILPFDGLIYNFCNTLGASTIFRGLRNESDFQSEMGLYDVIKQFAPEIHILFIPTEVQFRNISSSTVKELLLHGEENLEQFVTKYVLQKLLEK